MTKTYCGYAAIIGRPNVGKSTLLNRILGHKLSITSRKPQTTRHRILGVQTSGAIQTIYVDTPGLHLEEHRALNRFMNKAAKQVLFDVDVILFVVDGLKWTKEEDWIVKILEKVTVPIILVINKIDLIPNKEALLPYLKTLSEKYSFFKEMIPISARKGSNLQELQHKIAELLPESPHFFPDDQMTDQTLAFRIAEIIREKIIRILGQELPYTSAVEIESVTLQDSINHIHAIIWVERDSQKPIVIGKNGERLKEIGSQARFDLEKLLNTKVYLKLWVKVKGGWSDDERILASLGYLDLKE